MKRIILTAMLVLSMCFQSFALEMEPKEEVPLDKEWHIEFNKPFDLWSIDEGTMYVEDSYGNIVDTEQFYIDDYTVSIKPDEWYDPDSTYTLVITDKVKSEQGTPLTGTTMDFSTVMSYQDFTDWFINSDEYGYLDIEDSIIVFDKFSIRQDGDTLYISYTIENETFFDMMALMHEGYTFGPVNDMIDRAEMVASYYEKENYVFSVIFEGLVDRYPYEFEQNNLLDGTGVDSITPINNQYGIFYPVIVVTPDKSEHVDTSYFFNKPVQLVEMHLYSSDETYLGELTTNEFDSDSVFNSFGKYGSQFSQTSIWNEFSDYGSQFSNESAFNQFAQNPPMIYKGDEFVGYLTINKFKYPAINPHGLKEWLQNLGY